MFGDVGPPGENRVYFNVVAVHAGTAANPNSATLGQSRILPEHAYSFEALYGVWVDCNRDGYIGMADTALFEYRSEILIDSSACPSPSPHNQQGWVSEMRFIGRHQGAPTNGGSNPPSGRDARVISDYSSAVWGDRGLAGEPLVFCMKPTDAVLAAKDCSLQDLVDAAVPGPVRIVLDEASSEAEDTLADIRANRPVHPPFDPSPIEVVWDCKGVSPEQGSLRGYERMALATVAWLSGGECEELNEQPGGAPGNARVPAKRSADITFGFYEEQRSGASKGGEPMDRGVYPGMRANPVRYGGSHWYSHQTFVGTSAYAAVRSDLTPAGAQYFTFYANLSMSDAPVHALSLPGQGASMTYGTHWCRGITMGVFGGFDCDADAWYLEHDGSRAAGNEFLPLPGTLVQFYDVDCYDNRIGHGAHAEGFALDSSVCPRLW